MIGAIAVMVTGLIVFLMGAHVVTGRNLIATGFGSLFLVCGAGGMALAAFTLLGAIQ